MVRNARYKLTPEDNPRAIIAFGNEYPDDFEISPHHHDRAQFLHCGSGVMTVRTEHGAWVVPPQEAVWIPAGIEHSVRMIGPVNTQSLYVAPGKALGMAETCQVLAITPLMRELLHTAMDFPVDYDEASRDGLVMALTLAELKCLQPLPLSLPFPADVRLGRKCHKFLTQPLASDQIDQWAEDMAMSRRSFTRFFKRETGMSFAHWARQACLLSAMRRLAMGEAVTTVALDLGYESPAAFTTMFKKSLGVAPSRYFSATGNRTLLVEAR